MFKAVIAASHPEFSTMRQQVCLLYKLDANHAVCEAVGDVLYCSKNSVCILSYHLVRYQFS